MGIVHHIGSRDKYPTVLFFKFVCHREIFVSDLSAHNVHELFICSYLRALAAPQPRRQLLFRCLQETGWDRQQKSMLLLEEEVDLSPSLLGRGTAERLIRA